MQTGTTVTIRNLFRKLPVRYNEFKKTCKTQFHKAMGALQTYAIINAQINFSVSNTPAGTK